MFESPRASKRRLFPRLPPRVSSRRAPNPPSPQSPPRRARQSAPPVKRSEGYRSVNATAYPVSSPWKNACRTFWLESV